MQFHLLSLLVILCLVLYSKDEAQDATPALTNYGMLSYLAYLTIYEVLLSFNYVIYDFSSKPGYVTDKISYYSATNHISPFTSQRKGRIRPFCFFYAEILRD